MPELPEVESVRRAIAPVLVGARIASVALRRDGLRRPFPAEFAERVQGQRVVHLRRRGKYLLAGLSSGETLVIHLGMSGSFRVERDDHGGRPPEPHDHVVFGVASGVRLVFNDPRRFGVMDLIAGRPDARRALDELVELGPEPLGASFTAAALARACAGSRAPLKAILLDQRVVAGVGNIYAAEALHLAGLSPRRAASTIATPSGRPRPSATRLVAAVKTVLRRAIGRQARSVADGFRVYDREGERCRRRGCRGAIRRIVQSGRSTFYCPVCQR